MGSAGVFVYIYKNTYTCPLGHALDGFLHRFPSHLAGLSRGLREDFIPSGVCRGQPKSRRLTQLPAMTGLRELCDFTMFKAWSFAFEDKTALDVALNRNCKANQV